MSCIQEIFKQYLVSSASITVQKEDVYLQPDLECWT